MPKKKPSCPHCADLAAENARLNEVVDALLEMLADTSGQLLEQTQALIRKSRRARPETERHREIYRQHLGGKSYTQVAADVGEDVYNVARICQRQAKAAKAREVIDRQLQSYVERGLITQSQLDAARQAEGVDIG